MSTLSVIIPVYNEEKTIDTIIARTKAAPLPSGVNKEIIIVDDGSSDGTPQALTRHASDPSLRIFHHQENKGKASAVVAGIGHSTGDIIVIQDADLEYDPNDYQRLIEPLLKGESSVVYGSRFLGNIAGMTFINRAANIFSNISFNLLYGTRLTDINTCYKTITKDALQGMRFSSTHFGFDGEVTAKLAKKGFRIMEIPIHYKARTKQEGKKIDWPKALKLYWTIIKLRFVD